MTRAPEIQEEMGGNQFGEDKMSKRGKKRKQKI